MAACTQCGADLAPYTPRCTYCNKVTAFGAAQEAEQARYRAAAELQAAQARDAQARQAQYAANAEVVRSAETAFNWGLVGLFLCCIPVLPIVAIVMGLRSRSLAVSRGLIVPSKAWISVALGASSLVLFGTSLVLGMRLEAEKADRKARLEKALGDHAADATPSVGTVCKMTEIYLLDEDFDGKKLVDGDVNCDASKWSASDDHGELSGVRVSFYAHDPVKEGNVCLVHGQKWVVDAVVSTSCAEHWRAKSGAASASGDATTSAPPASAPTATPSSRESAPKPPAKRR